MTRPADMLAADGRRGSSAGSSESGARESQPSRMVSFPVRTRSRTAVLCPGDCAMYHACACPDKEARHAPGSVAGPTHPRVIPGRHLREALRRIREAGR